MERTLLCISEAQGFLLNAMIKNLTTHGFTVTQAQPDGVEAAVAQGAPSIFLFYLEGDIAHFNFPLLYLKKMMTEKQQEHLVLLIGTEDELAEAREVMPAHLITATFTRPVNVQDVIAKLEESLSPSLATRKKRILVVDDDSVALRAMKNLLATQYDVSMVTSGMNAISFLAQNKVDLVLLDYEMPVVSGLQVFEMLKSEPNTAGIPIIFLTAKDDKETVMKVLSVKPEKYLLKTMKPELLLRSIEEFFQGF